MEMICIRSPIRLLCQLRRVKASEAVSNKVVAGIGAQREERETKKLSRRSVLRGSASLVAAGALARPYIANAAATTATAWFGQGFVQSEDVALRKLVADYEKASGNTIDLSIVPFVALRQKEVAAITSGRRSRSDGGPGFFVYSLNAWDDKLLDVSDIIETQKSQYNEVVLLRRHLYNNVKTERGYYG